MCEKLMIINRRRTMRVRKGGESCDMNTNELTLCKYLNICISGMGMCKKLIIINRHVSQKTW